MKENDVTEKVNWMELVQGYMQVYWSLCNSSFTFPPDANLFDTDTPQVIGTHHLAI